MKTQNRFLLALLRLKADLTLQTVLLPSAAASKSGWAHDESLEIEEKVKKFLDSKEEKVRAPLSLTDEGEEENPPRNNEEATENGDP